MRSLGNSRHVTETHRRRHCRSWAFKSHLQTSVFLARKGEVGELGRKVISSYTTQTSASLPSLALSSLASERETEGNREIIKGDREKYWEKGTEHEITRGEKDGGPTWKHPWQMERGNIDKTGWGLSPGKVGEATPGVQRAAAGGISRKILKSK